MLLIAFLAFVGMRLAGLTLGLLSGMREIGNAPSAEEIYPADPTIAPPEFSDQDYDAVQGVPE